jgi:hypothetical protein
MKATGIVSRFLSFFIVFVFVLTAYNAFGYIVASYHWDGVLEADPLEGWTRELPFDGDLGVQTNWGNPGGSMFATDTKSAGSPLYARAPDTLSGDLTRYASISWDEYIPRRVNTVQSTFIILEGWDGTRYRSERLVGPDIQKNYWYGRSVPLDDPSAWFLLDESGSASFEDVIADVAGLFMSMDTSTLSNGSIESWVDNFTVYAVPIPGAVWLLGSGLAGLLIYRRKFQKK